MSNICKSCGGYYLKSSSRPNLDDLCYSCKNDFFEPTNFCRSLTKTVPISIKINERWVGNCGWDCDFMVSDAGVKCTLFQQTSLRKSLQTGNYERCVDCIRQFGE